MGDYTTSISFVCHMPPVFQTEHRAWHINGKKVQKLKNPTLRTHIVYKEIINSTFFRT